MLLAARTPALCPTACRQGPPPTMRRQVGRSKIGHLLAATPKRTPRSATHATAPGGALGPWETLKTAAYDTFIKTTLYGSYGALGLALAGLRRIYEGQLTPEGTVVTRNIAYNAPGTGTAEQRLDVLAPPDAKGLPVVIYMHGGAFVHGSKETHWMMPLPFLHMGCVVVNINYRLAPKHKFPTALEDACTAVGWVLDHIEQYGGDPTRLILAGDSAGGNLATGTCACMCWERPEPYAQALYARGVTPAAVLPHGAVFSMAKFDDHVAPTPQKARVAAMLGHINNYYLRPKHARDIDIALANPLRLCDPATPPARPLPPFFIAAGAEDPLLEDGVLAAACLRGAGAAVTQAQYEGGWHVFHALYFLPSPTHKIAVRHWVDTMLFLRGLGLVKKS